MAIKKKIKYWQGCWEKETYPCNWWKCKLAQPQWKTVWRFLEKWKIELPSDPVLPLLDTSPKELKLWSQRDYPHPPVYSRMSHNGYMHTMKYHSALKNVETPLCGTAPINLGYIMPSELSQAQKETILHDPLSGGIWNSPNQRSCHTPGDFHSLPLALFSSTDSLPKHFLQMISALYAFLSEPFPLCSMSFWFHSSLTQPPKRTTEKSTL